MSNEIRISLLFSLCVVFLIPVNVFAQSNWDEETIINVTIVGDPVINLDSSNTLIRAYVDITNFDPSDGYYFLRITQSDSSTIISEENIIIRQKSNGKAGADVAHLITEDEINHTGMLQGNYDILVFTEKGNAIGNATFSIIKPSIVIPQPVPELLDSNDVSVEKDESIISESQTSESELINIKKIPEWVKTIFVLYSYDEITENELLAALTYLIEEEIIKIN